MAVDRTESRLILTGDGSSLDRILNRADRGVRRFGGTVKRTGTRVQTFGTKLRKAFGVDGARFGGEGIGGLLGGAALVLAGKELVEFTGDLGRLAIQADITKGEVFGLKDSLNEFARVTFQKPGALLEGVAAIVERTGNIRFATDVIKRLGIISTATSTDVKDIGFAASDLNEKLDIDPNKILQAFDILATQGKAGAFELNKMAELFPRLLSVAAGFGVAGLEGLRGFGAFLQFAMKGTGDAQLAATAVENVFKDLIKKRKQILEKTGFDIIDVKASQKAGKEVFKNFDKVLKEIIARSGGSITKLNEIFGIRAIRAIQPLAKIFRDTGKFAEFDKLINIVANGDAIMGDFNKRISFTDQAFKKLSINLGILQQLFLLKPVQDLGGALDFVTPKLARLGKLPLFERSFWLTAVVGVGALAAGLGLTASSLAAIIATGLVLTGGAVAIPFGARKDVQEQAARFARRISPRINIPQSKQLPPGNNTFTVPIPKIKQFPLGNNTFAVPIPKIKQIIHINISDKQVSVKTDSGKAPTVNLERGSFKGLVP